jgi:two-component system chemotaxis sensor kinase CheA
LSDHVWATESINQPKSLHMDDLLSEFLTETSENLAVLDVELVKLERNPNDMELLGNIFRLVHTVKGTCGFLGLPRLEQVAHAGENILGKLRDGELVASPEAVTAVLECLDRIRSIMSDLEANGSEPEGDDSALIQRLNHIAEGGAAPVAETPTAAAPKSQPKAAAVATKSATHSIYEQIGGMGTIDAVVEVMFSRVMGDLRIKHLFDGVNLDRLQGRMREYLSLVCGGPNSFGKVDLKCPHASAVGKGMNDTHFDAFAGHMQAALNALEVPAHLAAMIMAIVFASRDEIMGRAESGSSPVNAATFVPGEPAHEPVPAPEAEPAPSKAAAAAAMAAAAPAKLDSETKDSAVANQSIRVNVELLENLMTMVSELVLTRNQVLQILRKQKDSEFAGPLQRLNHVTSELQEGVMKTRMQPIGNAWSKLPTLATS